MGFVVKNLAAFFLSLEALHLLRYVYLVFSLWQAMGISFAGLRDMWRTSCTCTGVSFLSLKKFPFMILLKIQSTSLTLDFSLSCA